MPVQKSTFVQKVNEDAGVWGESVEIVFRVTARKKEQVEQFECKTRANDGRKRNRKDKEKKEDENEDDDDNDEKLKAENVHE